MSRKLDKMSIICYNTDMETEEKSLVSLQDNDIKNKIRSLYLDGKEYKQIIEILEIPKGTWDNYYYLNKYDFRNFIQECKKERVLQTVEAFSKELMATDSEDNAKIKAIQQKEAEFLRETLLKELGYTKRIETIGLNINKNEPLDEEQKAKIDKLLGKTSKSTEYVDISQHDTVDMSSN